jgi:serpin B
MTHTALPALILAAVAATRSAMTQTPQDVAVSPNTKAVGTAINALAVDLWGKLAPAEGNLSCSPASIATALAMTTAGARGTTQQELLAFLHVADQNLLPVFGALGRRLTTEGKVKLAIANRLFGDKGCPFEKPYLELLAQGFGSPLESLDIRNEPEQTRLRVNDWVAVQTAQKIKDILPPQSVDKNTRLLLANAVHFLGDWARPFEASETKPQPFHLADGTTPNVPTMDQTANLEFAEVAGHQVVQLLYQDKEFGMLFVLPPKGKAPATWLGKAVLELPAKLEAQEVHLLLPRFRVEAPATTKLKATMQALGVEAAFDRRRADLTGIANPSDPNERLLIDDVYHKAFVRVDEKGTEAAAATVVSVARATAMPPPAREVRFDRPFAFVLRHLPSGAALFVGKVVDPR